MEKEIKIDVTTINIAISAINEWRNQILIIEGQKDVRGFDADTKKALEIFKIIESKLSEGMTNEDIRDTYNYKTKENGRYNIN